MWVTVPSSFSLKMLSLSKASALNLQERVKAGLGIPFPAAHSALAPWPGRLVPLGMGSQAIAPGPWGQQHPWGSSRGRPVTWSHPQWPRVLLTYRCPSAAPGARSPKLLSEGRRRSGGEAARRREEGEGFWGFVMGFGHLPPSRFHARTQLSPQDKLLLLHNLTTAAGG